MKNNFKKFLSDLGLKKKYFYSKHLVNLNVQLKNLFSEKQKYKKLNYIVQNNKKLKNKKENKSFVVVYIIHFLFTTTNTFLYITDSLGNLKFRYSSGLVDFKGKQKRVRIQVLGRFLKILKRLKKNVIQTKPVALHLTNVGFYRFFIMKNLKKEFFVRFVKNYQVYAYNGCRKRKKIRKR